MKITEGLEAISAAYIPGARHHFAKMNPDPWQRADDSLEAVLNLNDLDLISSAVDAWVSECKRLITAFRQISAPAKEVSPADMAILGDSHRIRAWQNRKHKVCFYCAVKEGLVLMKDPKDKANALVVCQECKASHA